jgi:hypothetical protein
MAIVHPPLHTIHVMSKGQHVEFQVLRRLAVELPDTLELFHSVDWAQVRPDGDTFGEIDIMVLNQKGDLALLEIKAGDVQFMANGIFKRYGTKQKNVSAQVQWQFSGIQHRLRNAGLKIRLMNYLVLPDVRLKPETATVGFPRERILDSQDCLQMADILLAGLGVGQTEAARDQVRAFLLNELPCKVDVATMAGQLQSWTQHLSGGLAEWVPRMTVPQRILRVQATAGSGKTQLALTLLRRATAAGRQAAYVCFNRPLADHMRQIAPAGVEVRTFHQLCWAAAQKTSPLPDLSTPSFNQTAELYARAVENAGPDLDLLVVDELQDLQVGWLQTLASRVRALAHGDQTATELATQDGLVLLDDPDQCLYADREEVDLPEAVVVACHDNYRSPRQVVQVINALQLTGQPVVAKSPHEGQIPVFRTWPTGDGEAMQQRTVEAVQACLSAGFRLDQICLITWRGNKHSTLQKCAQLGEWALYRDERLFDHQAPPSRSSSAMRMETLRRFKGQSAAAIVLTEIDEEDWTAIHRHMLFVGMTRATLHLELVMSDRVENQLMQSLG